jgi:hypothetical protein
MSVCVAAGFGTSGEVVVVTEAGNLWKNAGYTYTGDMVGMPAVGPSRRCLNAIEALFMLQKGALLLQRCSGCEKLVETLAKHEAIEYVMPFVDYKVFETYSALKDKGFVVRFPHPDDVTVMHVYYVASTFKYSKPRDPDAVVRVHGWGNTTFCNSCFGHGYFSSTGVSVCGLWWFSRASDEVPFNVYDVSKPEPVQVIAIAGVDELVTLSCEIVSSREMDLTVGGK